MNKVCICVVYLVMLCKNAVMADHELEALDPAGIMCVVDSAFLKCGLFPVGRTAGNNNLVTWFEVLYKTSNFLNHSNGLMSENHIRHFHIFDDGNIR